MDFAVGVKGNGCVRHKCTRHKYETEGRETREEVTRLETPDTRQINADFLLTYIGDCDIRDNIRSRFELQSSKVGGQL
jgi:hypothetical protein